MSELIWMITCQVDGSRQFCLFASQKEIWVYQILAPFNLKIEARRWKHKVQQQVVVIVVDAQMWPESTEPEPGNPIRLHSDDIPLI